MVLIPKSTYERMRGIGKGTVSDITDGGSAEIDKTQDMVKQMNSDSGIDMDKTSTSSERVSDTQHSPTMTIPQDLIEKFPDNYRFYAKRLLIYIRKHGSSVLEWGDKDNVIKYKGITVEGSSIIDLINHVFKTNSRPPQGSDRFKRGLKEIKVPKVYLKPYLLKLPDASNKIKKKWLKY